MATDDLSAIRAKAAQHQEEIEARTSWFTPAELAARWRVSQTTVRDIPRDELPYREFGQGLQKRRRRYSPEAVAAYERSAAPASQRRKAS